MVTGEPAHAEPIRASMGLTIQYLETSLEDQPTPSQPILTPCSPSRYLARTPYSSDLGIAMRDRDSHHDLRQLLG